MNKIISSASAGTLESSDVYIEVEPSENNEVTVESVVLKQFGDSIVKTAESVLDELNVKNAKVHIIDKGALDCVIRARLETALRRAEKENK